jgi:hypothetical protein
MADQNEQMNQLGLAGQAINVLAKGPVMAATEEVAKVMPPREGMFEPVTEPTTFKPEDIEVTREEFKVPFTDTQFLGTGVTTERGIKYDWTKAKNIDVSVTDILPFDNKEWVQSQWQTAIRFVNAKGDSFDVRNMSAEEKIEAADKFGAVSIVYPSEFDPEGLVSPIPWDEAITRFTKLPEYIGMGLEAGSLTADDVRRAQFANKLFGTVFSADPEFGRATYAQYMNEYLIEKGMDSRARYMIINKGMKGYGMDELQRVVTGFGENTLKATAATTLWGVGEISGMLAAGFGVDGPAIADYQTRGDIMDSWWEPSSYRIQEWGAENNIEIPLGIAEDLASMYTGYLPRAIQLAAEVRSGSAISNARQYFRSKADLDLFNTYVEKQRSVNPNLTDTQILENFTNERGLAWGPFGRFKGSYQQRLSQAYQVQDANLPINERAEVKQVLDSLSVLDERRGKLVQRMDEDPLNPSIQNQIDRIDDQARSLQYRLVAVSRRSNTPKFIRDTNIQDNYMIVGAAAFGTFFGEYADSVDAEMGELIGLGTGLALSISKGKLPNLLATMGTVGRGPRKKIEFIGRRLQNYSPEMREIITYQAQKMDEYRNKLMDLGVREDVLDLTLPVITDIVTLRHLVDSVQREISIKGVVGSAESENLQRLQRLETELNAELNRVLVDFKPSNEAESNFVKMVGQFDTALEDVRDEISNATDILAKKGVGHFLSHINGRSSAFEPLALRSGKAYTFEGALATLLRHGLVNKTNLNADQFKLIQREQTDFVAGQLSNKSNKIISELGDIGSARTAVRTGIARVDRLPNIPQYTSASGLFSMHMQLRHADAKSLAERPYKIMSDPKITYKTASGEIINGTPTVDAFDLFDSLMEVEIPGMGPLTRFTKSDVSPADKRAFGNTIESFTDPFFETLASNNNITKDELLRDIKAQLESEGVSFPKGQNVQAIIAMEAYRKGNTAMFQLNPTQLREFGSTISSLKWKNKDNPVFNKIDNIDGLLNEKFNQFEVDGNPIGMLNIEHPSIEGGSMPFGQYLNQANKGWSDYKRAWFDDVDGGIVPNWMSWGSQKKEAVSAAHPGGVAFKDSVDNWLRVDRLASDKSYANNWMASVGRAVGDETVDPEVGAVVRTFREGAPNTKNMQIHMRAAVAEWMMNNFDGMSDAQRKEFLVNLNNNITMIDANGNRVPLIDTGALIDDLYGYSSKAVGKELFDQTEEVITARVNDAINAATEPARKKVAQLGKSIQIIRDVAGLPSNFTPERVAQSLITGGSEQYNNIRNAMIDGALADGMSRKAAEKLVDQNLTDIYMLTLENATFVKTGKKTLVPINSLKDVEGKKIIDGKYVEVDAVKINVRGFQQFLGETEEQKAVARQILGDDRYDAAETMYGFLSEMESNPMAMGIRGIPRAMSVESVISRIYAINRGVISPKYVGTEALLQTMRGRNYKLLTSMINDPELGKLLLETMRTGKPLDPIRNARIESLLLQSITQQHTVTDVKTQTVVDPIGRKYETTIFSFPSPEQRKVFETGGVMPRGENGLYIPSLDIRNLTR